MSELLWSFEKLAWYARAEDTEVRYWAVERLVRCYPEAAHSVIALLILDEHETTPDLVATNLKDYGTAKHVPLLLRAYRQMEGTVPGRAFEALARIGHKDVLALARSAVDRADLTEASLPLIVEATARVGTEEARAVVREMVERRVELLAEPGALRAALESYVSEDLPVLFASFARALQWRGLGRCSDLLRVITDSIEADDCGWCLRTGPDGRIDLPKTIKAVESGYDCEVEGPPPALTPEVVRHLLLVFRSGDLQSAIASLAGVVQSNAAAISARAAGGDDLLPGRISAIASALASSQFRAEAERIGPVFEQGVTCALLSCLFKVARYRNYAREVALAGDDTEALLALGSEETAFLLDRLPRALARSARPAETPQASRPGGASLAGATGEGGGGEHARRRERILEWCRRMLEARGPFFPKAIALEAIGELRAEDHVPELLDFLSDENSYIFIAAEKALAKLGGAIVGPTRARLEAGTLDHEVLHSLLILLVEHGDRASLSVILDHFDDFVENVGVGETAEWVSLLGAQDLFEPLHRLLQRDVARVGQALLLIGSIHNIPVPEEPQIQQAIEDYWRRHQTAEGAGGDEEGGSGSYLM